MLNFDKSMKVIVVAVVYVAVALIVTGGFVLRSNNVLAATETTIHSKDVVKTQHTSLNQRYQRFANLSARVINQEVALELVDEALDIADQYMCEEMNHTNAQRAFKVLLQETGAIHKLRSALPETPVIQHLLIGLGK